MEKAHTHQFIRVRNNTGDYYWRCNNPDCYFKCARSDIRGKRSLCNKCGVNTFIMEPDNLQYAFPKCDECSQSIPAKLRLAKKHATDSTINAVVKEAMSPKSPLDDLDSDEGELPEDAIRNTQPTN